MAGIDKLYCHSYLEYDDLLRWSLIYYPKLINYFYNIHISPTEFENNLNKHIERTRKIYEKDFKKIEGFKNLDEAKENLHKHYKNINYDASDKQLEEEVALIISNKAKPDSEIIENYSIPILNTPFKVDNYLKWICPLPFVRKYLHNQCGVNQKWEWLYKIFWKGKSEFLY